MAKYKGSTLSDGTPLNVAVYKAYRNAGLSHNQALAITAEVGRENGFNASTLFGSHTDPAANSKGGAIRNVGMLSWNQGRDTQVLNYLAKKGVIANGRMPKNQANLNAQAEFSVWEMKQPRYAGKLQHFWRNPNASPESFAKELGRNYIVWAYGQNTIKGKGGGRVPFNWGAHDSRRRGYLNTLSGMLGGNTNYTAPAQSDGAAQEYQAPPPDPRLSMSAPDLLAHYRKNKDGRSDVQLLYELAHNNGLAGREINTLLGQGHALGDIAGQLGLKMPVVEAAPAPVAMPSFEEFAANYVDDEPSQFEFQPVEPPSFEDFLSTNDLSQFEGNDQWQTQKTLSDSTLSERNGKALPMLESSWGLQS